MTAAAAAQEITRAGELYEEYLALTSLTSVLESAASAPSFYAPAPAPMTLVASADH